MIVVVAIIAFSAKHLTFAHLEPPHTDLETVWVQFVGVILALSGVEAIANLTGVMKLDPNATPEAPKVTRTATKAIVLVAIEVVGCHRANRVGDAFAAESLSHRNWRHIRRTCCVF